MKVIETDFEVNTDGSVNKMEKPKGVNPDSKWDLICAAIDDEESDPSTTSRWIAREIADVARRMSIEEVDVKVGTELIKAMRSLGAQLTDSESLSHRDFLNFDGARFSFVMSQVVEIFKITLKESGLSEDMVVSVLKQLRDNMVAADPMIRKETAKIGAK
jgi:hypothetical protein